MNDISQLDDQLTAAIERLRSSITARFVEAPPRLEEGDLLARLRRLENENSALVAELENLRVKRDKDVAALDELIAQLKPLIEEV